MPTTMTIGLDEDSYVSEVATEAELLEFCNRVREAGGANILEALLPSVPGVASQCLIANSLNFGCRVEGFFEPNGGTDNRNADGSYVWGMFLPDNMEHSRMEKIAAAVDCPLKRARTGEWAVVLPKHIGNAAAAFDSGAAFRNFSLYNNDENA